MTAPVVSQHLVGTEATLRFTVRDDRAEPAAPGTDPTVNVVDSKGDPVASGTTDTGQGTGAYTFKVPVGDNQKIDRWTATWTVGGNPVGVTGHDVVSDMIVTVADVKLWEPTGETSTLTADQLEPLRFVIDQQLCRGSDSWLNRGGTGRFDVYDTRRKAASTTQLVPYPDVTEIRWAQSVADDGTVTDIDVSTVPPDKAGILYLAAGWPAGRVRIGYTHGWTTTPPDLVRIAASLVHVYKGKRNSMIPDRAVELSDPSGMRFQLMTPGERERWATEHPEANEWIVRNRWNGNPGIA